MGGSAARTEQAWISYIHRLSMHRKRNVAYIIQIHYPSHSPWPGHMKHRSIRSTCICTPSTPHLLRLLNPSMIRAERRIAPEKLEGLPCLRCSIPCRAKSEMCNERHAKVVRSLSSWIWREEGTGWEGKDH